MKTLVFNEKKLNDKDIDEIVTRVKAFVINDSEEVLYANADGCLQLPGGHRENNEEYEETLIRELEEEVGLSLNKEEIKFSFFEIKHYIENYKDSGKNRIANIIYYLVKTNKEPDLSKIHLTEHERMHHFKVNKIKFNDFGAFVEDFIVSTGDEYFRLIANETLLAYGELKKLLNKE
jgi:8-oxo-dGTP pyrophosphatase MutT (NUDIX family)